MLKYLVVMLSDSAVSFCHYDTNPAGNRVIAPEALKEVIFWGMKENLMIQFVYPDAELPEDINDLVETIDHIKIRPASKAGAEDIGVVNNWDELVDDYKCDTIVIRTDIGKLTANKDALSKALAHYSRVNVVLTDINTASETAIERYKKWLIDFSKNVMPKMCVESGKLPQLNILTDRVTLESMNNCNAGVETITVAPDGNFYICPAFYCDGESPVGNPAAGIDIPNAQLYDIDHATICKKCDAWHCNRCVWSNKQRTHEVNTPGHRQCLIAHAEREASRQFQSVMKERGTPLPGMEITEIDYNDPFEIVTR